jgi:hypothetical protein
VAGLQPIDRLPFYRDWLENPSFNVSMLAEQSLNLIVTLTVIATLLLMRKKRAGELRYGEVEVCMETVIVDSDSVQR